MKVCLGDKKKACSPIPSTVYNFEHNDVYFVYFFSISVFNNNNTVRYCARTICEFVVQQSFNEFESVI